MREPSPPRPSTVSGRASLTEAQFAELYPGLRRFAGAIGAPVVDADDLVQEACVRYMRRTGTEPVTDVGAYLRRTMLNLELTRRTTEQRRERVHARLVGPESTEPSYPSDLADLMALDPIDRALLYLTAVERWRFAEAAELLERPEAALRMRATRARRALPGDMEARNDG